MVWTGSPEQRRAYAIKMRIKGVQVRKQETRRLPEAPQQAPEQGFSVHPSNHACSAHEITYHASTSGRPGGATCGTCGREWKYSSGPFPKVTVTPLTKRRPGPRIDWSAAKHVA